MAGTHGLHTLKLQGKVKNKQISMLLDSGSTHNFISQSLVKACGLKTEPCKPMVVTIANGEKIKCDKQIMNFTWNMSNENFNSRMYVIPLGGYDAVLGVQWMKEVSPMLFDFHKGEVTFT